MGKDFDRIIEKILGKKDIEESAAHKYDLAVTILEEEAENGYDLSTSMEVTEEERIYFEKLIDDSFDFESQQISSKFGTKTYIYRIYIDEEKLEERIRLALKK